MEAACSGFIYALEVAEGFITSGKYKKVLVIAGDILSILANYADRNTCPIFGDGCGCVMLEATTEEVGMMDSILRSDGSIPEHLHVAAGGSFRPTSHETVDQRQHYIYQEGRVVFKHAVSNMVSVCEEIAKRNNLTGQDIDWIVPHQANLRIIDAVAQRLDVSREKVMINIEKFGNTSAGTIPICLWEWEPRLRKGDNIILTAFGAGFTWGATYLKWGYDPT
jgi:3-oxoacyl-[acyl-carrier-protein] synthase-3